MMTRAGGRSVSLQLRRGAFTLVELVVVIIIITILISAVITASVALLASSKAQATQAMLKTVDTALREFEQNPPAFVAQARWGSGLTYRTRYGASPPDELEVFTAKGLVASGSGSGAPLRIVRPSEMRMVPDTQTGAYPAMKFIESTNPADMATEHRDLAAMYLALELYSEPAKVILEKIPERYWRNGPAAADGTPLQYLDRTSSSGWSPVDDIPVRYLVDDWRVPILYLSQRDSRHDAPPTVSGGSSNHPAWSEASSEMVALNGNRPVLMSYGPDGREQLTGDVMGDNGRASLVNDWVFDGEKHRIDHPMNLDNIFVDETIREKLFKGLDAL